jgi:serine protein kinase
MEEHYQVSPKTASSSLQAEAKQEGMVGISARYIQDKLSNVLVSNHGATCINPFYVMRELESGLKHHSLITSEEQRKRYRELLSVVREEYDEIVKHEVQMSNHRRRSCYQTLVR